MQMVLIAPDELTAMIAQAVKDGVSLAMAGVTPSQESEPLINQKELSKKLGVTEQTVIRWKAKKKIPFKLVGTAPRFSYSEVLKAIER